jgi:multidrug efflux pump subunit AcrA (membrane-fusion protein)
MRALLVLVGLAAIVLVVLMSLGMVSIGGGSLPSVKVEAGTAPKVDVGTIDVGTVNKTVAVPAISVTRADNATEAK